MYIPYKIQKPEGIHAFIYIMAANGFIDPVVLSLARSYGTIYLYSLVGYIFFMIFDVIIDTEMFSDIGSKWLLDPTLTYVA